MSGNRPGDDHAEFKASGSYKIAKWSLIAKGSWAFVALVGFAFAAELVWLQPLTNAQHFVLTLVTGVTLGAMLGMAVQAGRVNDFSQLLIRKDDELNRVTSAKAALEGKLLSNRQSSQRSTRKR
jgi:hypothetical protein